MVSALVPEASGLASSPGVRFLKFPVITGLLICFVFHSRGSFKGFENYTVKLSAKETKWNSSEVRIRPTFLETDIKI